MAETTGKPAVAPKQSKGSKASKGGKKIGRGIKKRSRKGNPMSQYVKGQISFEKYEQLTRQSK